MTIPGSPPGSQQAAVEVVLKSMGLSLEDLTASPGQRPTVPTFADYVPVVSATVTDGTRRAYGSYWNRVVEQWGTRRLDEPTPSEIRQLVAHVRTSVVPRRNARGGRGAAENLIAALRCLYRRAEDDGLIDERDNPARKVGKPRRLPSTSPSTSDSRPYHRHDTPKTKCQLHPDSPECPSSENQRDPERPGTHAQGGGSRPGPTALTPDSASPPSQHAHVRRHSFHSR